MNYKNGAGFFGVFLLVVLLIILSVSIYFFYLNLPGESVEYLRQESVKEGLPVEPEYSVSEQFYENMRFRENRVSYRIESVCSSKKRKSAEEAFKLLGDKSVIDFYPAVDENAEITIFCSQIEPEPENEGFFVAGEGGPTEVINTSLYNVILSGKVSLFREDKCDEPKVATHEILHVLGFNHNNNPRSILYPTLGCGQELDDSIVEDINDLYSVESLPDLKIVEVDATKSGRYLNFKVTITNQGLKDVKDVYLTVYSEDKFVKKFELGNIDIGTKKFLEVSNLRTSFLSRGENVKFFVDEKNEIREIFEDNNQVELILNS